jgi:cell division protein FtsQ
MSSMIRDPLRPPGQGHAARLGAPRPDAWPADPRNPVRRAPPPIRTPAPNRAPIGADWDPLSEAWPAPVAPADALRPFPDPAVSPDRLVGPDPAFLARHGLVPELVPTQGGPDAVPGMNPARGVWPCPGAVTSRPVRQVVSLSLPPEPVPLRDVSPSLFSYRLNRLWLTPGVRHFVRHGLPALLLALALAAFWSGEDRRTLVIGFFADLRAAIDARPEFRIDHVQVLTDTPEVAQAVLARLDLTLPASSLRLDLEDLRSRALALDAVAQAAIAVRTGGVLEIRVIERAPALIWRHAGGLDLIDPEGRRVARIVSRAVRPDLPLVAGEGAIAAIAEAQALLAAADPIRDRILGLVRVGERRWDVVLDTDLRIQLPAHGAVQVLERVLALDGAHDLLSRDLAVVDMRNPVRPTLRLTPGASAELTRIRNLNTRMANR